ncbi:MAG: COX15/CtaA family protein [Verrucomicrobiota bacterium]
MTRSDNNPWLNRFAVLTAIATLALIGIGGLVTSHGAGMAVPDWPTTYGYNMFLFPISQWVGGIFYEHTHRLAASFVGLLTAVLSAWIWLKESRAWVRWLGLIAFFGVVFQGVLGGLRVTLYKDEIGIFHALLAQLFLVLVSVIALVTSRWWQTQVGALGTLRISRGLRQLFVLTTLVILIQLVLGATMRHQHAGLAIPDFPLAYGKIWPPMDAITVEAMNQTRLDTRDFRPISAFHIGVHMAHRLGALLVLVAVAGCCLTIHRCAPHATLLAKMCRSWFVLILFQAALGALTIWRNKPADVATLHVVFGAVILVAGAQLTLISYAQSWKMQPELQGRRGSARLTRSTRKPESACTK